MLKHKITDPGLPIDIVQRERLFCLLEKDSEKPIKWIAGPGGSGKTTLVSSFLETRTLPALWYQVDLKDADPATFFYYLGQAFRDCVSPDQEHLPLLTPEYLTGLKSFTRRYFETLFATLPVPYAIVFDNYQDVSPSSLFHALIVEAISVIPAGITFIILSRNEPPPILTCQDVARKFDFIGWNDLRFSFDEAQQFAEIQTDKHLDIDLLTRLYTKTDGWIAGLFLMLESMKVSSFDSRILESLPLDKVFDFFAEKIFDESAPELQNFLLKTACAPGISAHMAEQLTGDSSSEMILSRLCRNRFFTELISSASSIYQYHPLFREFLLARAVKTFSNSELKEIRSTTAYLLKKVGRTEDAAGLLLEAADWTGLTELILNAAPGFVAEGRSEAVHVWVQGIPEEIVAAVPGLLYWKGICLLLHSPSQSRNCFRKAFDLYTQAADWVGTYLSWCAGVEVSLYDGEFAPVDEWLSLLGVMPLDDGAFPSQQLEAQVSMSVFNAMSFRQPHHPDISKWRERGAPFVYGGGDISLRLQAAIQLAVHDLWKGNFARATFMLEQAQEMARSSKISPMTDITIRNGQVLHAVFTGTLAHGVSIALDAVRMADETGVHILDRQVLGNGAACALSIGDFATADELLEKMESSLRERWGWKGFDTGYYHVLRGWQKNHQNDFSAAAHHLELAWDGFQISGFVAPMALVFYLMALNLRERGDAEQAGACLMQAHAIADGMTSGFLTFLCLCSSAHLALDASCELEAIRLLRQAMALGRKDGYAGDWFWRRPSSLLRLCIKALENDIEVDYVRGLICRWSLVPETPQFHLDAWPWPVKIHTIGAFKLIRDDKPIDLSGKIKKPLELLKTLIHLGGMNVSQELLADTLWPEADGDMARRSFDTTLHRLRKLLGNENILQLQAGMLSIDQRYCWVDSLALNVP
jgi:ATP/maltotriose-dependent transcriptional regulator MalT